ncbi:DUF4167 domain-containing protein [Sphingomonas sp. PL-96]|uniref:DUF4167 domain-containing protein n=1 Tax=Sphingomonas sp. PL-96 TaxID=2887201 RepID=UPI001E34E669|nr:DUF4167 domain-containing protein [Sphingomonas sp. PL-96]MCC2978162.1 DUF4167 domain-containing protein [Sphingomonas sp. PL-96]
MINNRQVGRRRGRGGQRPQGGGNPGRSDNGNRIDSRARGNAAQLLEKYRNLARDAQMQGDRVNSEYYFQFADHYFRVLNDNKARVEENQRQRGDFGSEDDGEEFEFDGENGGSERPQREERAQREDRPRREERVQREDRPQRDDRPQREERAQREDRPQRDARPRSERAPRGERPAVQQTEVDGAPVEQAEPVQAAVANDIEATPAEGEVRAPRTRRRVLRRDAEPQPAEAASAGETHGIEADRLPPALSPAEGDGEERPRRRRRVRTDDEVMPPAA